MAQHMYKCPDCGASFADVDTRADYGRCDCGAMGEKQDAIGSYALHQDDRYKKLNDLPPGEAAAVRRVQKQYEDMSADILSGEVTIAERGPLALRPQVPDHLKRRYY